ncbi:hypothetical protein GJ744_007119 [Endocarpon pusillum]|uniref:Uncharacterized protein n=1 Tax=Endocarpon pusillum TaxID=364733 RepID=A0A8H7AJ18_9EURO|nr:hypothetical protein GJ744_007119 [Endocarpon pusillum]
MVAQFLQNANGLQRLASLASEEALDVRAVDEVVVQVKLKWSHLTKDDMFVFDGGLIPSLPICVRTRCISSTKDGQLELLAEVGLGPQVIGVGKSDEGIILGQVVLDRGSRKDDTTVYLQSVESRKGQTFPIFQPMSFIAKQKSNLSISQFIGVESQSLIRHDQYWPSDCSP